MKKMILMLTAALVALSLSVPAFAEEKKAEEKPAAEAKTEKMDKKAVKKDKKAAARKDEKKAEGDAKPAKKGKKEVSGC